MSVQIKPRVNFIHPYGNLKYQQCRRILQNPELYLPILMSLLRATQPGSIRSSHVVVSQKFTQVYTVYADLPRNNHSRLRAEQEEETGAGFS